MTWVCCRLCLAFIHSIHLSGCHYLVYYHLLFCGRSVVLHNSQYQWSIAPVIDQEVQIFESILKDCTANIFKRHIVIGYSKKEKMNLLVYARYGNRYGWLALSIHKLRQVCS